MLISLRFSVLVCCCQGLLANKDSYYIYSHIITSHCDVEHSERPVEVLKPLSSTEALVGETATFTCQLSKPNQDVVWNVGDKVIKASDDKYEVESHDLDYTLKIKNCTLDDAGEVSLTVGDQKTSAQLVVAGSMTLVLSM